MKQIFIIAILLFNLYTYGQNTFASTVSNGLTLVTPKNALATTHNIGLCALTSINDNTHAEIGLSIEYFNLSNFQNSEKYISNWSNGLYESNITKEANIQQLNLRFPLIINFNYSKLFFGAGIYISHLVYSRTNQAVSGTYGNYQFPAADDAFTKSVKYVFDINNDQTLYYYRRTNIAPTIRVGKLLGKTLLLVFESHYSIYGQTQYTNKISPFHLLSFNLNTYIKFK